MYRYTPHVDLALLSLAACILLVVSTLAMASLYALALEHIGAVDAATWLNVKLPTLLPGRP